MLSMYDIQPCSAANSPVLVPHGSVSPSAFPF